MNGSWGVERLSDRAQPMAKLHYARRVGFRPVWFGSVWRALVLGFLLALGSIVIWRTRVVHEVGICSRCECFCLRTRYLLDPVTVFVVKEKIANADWAAWNESITAENSNCVHAWQWTDAARGDKLFALHEAVRDLQPVLQNLEAMLDSQGRWYEEYQAALRAAFDKVKPIENLQTRH